MPAAPSRCRACSARPKYPTWEELQFFLSNGSQHHALRKDEAINHVHWATTRRRDIPSLMALAIDHRVQLEEIADELGADAETDRAISRSWRSRRRPRWRTAGDGYGMLIDEKYGREAMFEFARAPLRLDRPPGGAAGLAAAALRVLAGYRLAARRMAGRPLHQVPLLLSSGRSGRAEGRAAGESCARSSRPRARSAASC